MRGRLRIAFVLFLVTTGAAVAAPAPTASVDFAALDGLEKGQWELRARGESSAPRRICLGEPRQLLQTEHPGLQCRRFVVADKTSEISVTYDCGGAGNGRTDLRIETARLVQIQSQGVAGGAPFSHAIEGRRVGVCR